MKDILVIMGSHPRTRNDFDWARTDCDILVFNEALKEKWVLRADIVTQMHLPVIWRNPGNRNDPHHYERLMSGETPMVLMQEHYDDVPKSVKYPLEEVLAMGRRYITSSAAFSIAYGIYAKYKKIEVYGVEMETNTEYAHQRPGVAYWVGVCDGRGIELDFHGEMFKCPLYGYDGDVKFKMEYFDERLAQLNVTTEQAQKEYNNARELANETMRSYIETGSEPKKVIQLLQRQVEFAALFGLQDGARQEVKRYQDKANVQIKATGDYLFSRQEFEFATTSFLRQRDVAIHNAESFAKQCQVSFENVVSTGNLGKRKARMNNFIEQVKNYIQESVKVGMYDGASKENHLFMLKLDELVRMAGGAASEEVLLAQYQQADA